MKGGVRAPRTVGGTWAYRIDLGAVRGRGRNQKQVAGFGSREEAEAALAEALAAYGGGDRRSVAGYLELVWLPAKRLEVDRSTFDQYVWAVRRHIVPTLGRCKLAELEPRMIEGWLRGLGRPGRTDGGRPLSAASVRLVRKVLSMACEAAVEGGVLGDNPLRRVAAPPVEGEGAIDWTVEEADRFLGAARDHRLGAAFDLIVLAGLRRGEVLGLRWPDLDLAAGRLRVAQQLTVEGGRARLKPVPERHRRTVSLPAGLVHLLAEHRAREAAEDRGDGAVGDGEDLVFRAPGGGWLSPERFNRAMDRLIDQSRVPRITADALRRAGSLLAPRAATGGTEGT